MRKYEEIITVNDVCRYTLFCRQQHEQSKRVSSLVLETFDMRLEFMTFQEMSC